MYLLNWCEEGRFVEASLGGRITAQEMSALGEEVVSVLAHMDGACDVVLDYTKALPFDSPAYYVLGEIKDRWLETGAEKIVSMPHEGAELEEEVSLRIQQVLEGKEEFVREYSNINLKIREQEVRRAA